MGGNTDMYIPPAEMVVLTTIHQHVACDLRDRGLLSSDACDTFLDRLASERGKDPWHEALQSFLFRELPCCGKAFDAFLLTDNCTPRDLHAEILQELWLHTVPILGIKMVQSLLDGPENLEATQVSAVRQILYLFYKYEAPYEKSLVQAAINKFVECENQISDVGVDLSPDKALLERILRGIDLSDIHPRHGPGSVSGRELGPAKYRWSALPERLLNVYSHDYFVASFGHLSRCLSELMEVSTEEPSARLLTVPKDSRGPRVISCEPKEFQWIQQGIMSRLFDWIESHPLTRRHVRFTDQSVNGRLALEASQTRHYATLDLSEASDRVSLDYVTKVFPSWVLPYLLSCRSLSTRLPDGQTVCLKKFAPMGSALCFPILALTCFTRLVVAGIHDCHVYGDDVIVPTAQADHAIKSLEAIGLKVNVSKSCMSGFFRESCGVDAFRGKNVTPLRIKERWTSRPHPNAYEAWLAYANQLFNRGLESAADFVARSMVVVYGPMLHDVPQSHKEKGFVFSVPGTPPVLVRLNSDLQLMEARVWAQKDRVFRFRTADPENLILHWLSRKGACLEDWATDPGGWIPDSTRSTPRRGLRVSQYTKRKESRLVRAWTAIRWCRYPIGRV